ncbi:glycosyltransferase family 2 protein [Qingshengfaniella alkalisoli]|uniref:Glycosyltransferase n=1 Tax=Qingshengfaniella alkalisoli TaxID=2599296 RepID=A0A5B8J4D3_9RHOB|nr:glycosyltransferase [Qingshengfaniella alkalisoli]QDY71568.1 glycosyltransferase [Qingshengfaniella alkalisoli]
MSEDRQRYALAVIIPHYNDLDRLRTCLEHLHPQLSTDVECVVVDNGSDDDIDGLMSSYPDLRLVVEPQKGAAAARNRGVRETTAPLLTFLDCDCKPAPDWISCGREVAARGDLVGGRVDTFDETPAPRSGAEAFETVFAFHQRDYVKRKGFSVTANLLTPRSVFEAVGPFRNEVAEDVDWCHRATALGHKLVYADEWRVAHPTRQDWAALRKKWRRTTNERFQLAGTGFVARLKWSAMALVVLASGPAHLPKVWGSRRLSTREKYRGSLTLLRIRSTRAIWMVTQALTG